MICVDTECGGLDILHGVRPFFITTCDEESNQKWWEFDVDPYTRNLSECISVDVKKEVEEGLVLGGDIIGQNIKFDIRALNSVGIGFDNWPWERTQDTLIAGHLLASGRPHDLTSMVLQYLGMNIGKYEENLQVAVMKCRTMCR